jgi:MFS transporter, AAHS family, benzoate transport protein
MSAPAEAPRQSGRRTLAVVLTCAAVVLFEGYDQSVYGAVLPELVRDPAWHLSNGQAGLIGSAAFGGMLVGALAAGRAAARTSRRVVVTACLLVMVVFGTWCAATTSGPQLAGARFLTGVGLGGVLPLTSTITLEVAPERRRGLVYAAMFAAIPLGGLLGALLAIPVIPVRGPMALFVLPLPLAVVALLAAWIFLPNTPAGGNQAPEGRPRVSGRMVTVTALFVGATLLGLMMWYGLNTWLPGIMRASGYDLGSSLSFQVVLNAGAAIGSLATALLADRIGTSVASVAIYLGAALVLVAVLTEPPRSVLYLLVLCAGTGAQGGLVVLNSLVDRSYPARLRAEALGLTLGIGRIGAIIAPAVVGLIVGHSSTGSFVLFAGCAVLAAALIVPAVRLCGDWSTADGSRYVDLPAATVSPWDSGS